jgi:hypothetical protein
MIIHYMAQGSTEWLKLREKKVTGTSLTRVRGAKWLEYADVIVRERVTGERKSNEFKSFSMDNGHVLEPFARTAYEEFRKYKVTEVGFLQSEQFENFGMSPDGVIFIDGNVIKYISRHRSKNGAADVRKAIHYCQMILQMEYGEHP